MASGERPRRLEAPTTSKKQTFFSPLSYSRSTSSITPLSNHRNSEDKFPTPVPPPPPSIQKALLVEDMAPISPFVEHGEMSRLLSLSGNGTPRSILSNKSSTTEQMKMDLHEVLLYIDGLTFNTPNKEASMVTPMPPRTASHTKPPLGDRTNTQFKVPSSAWKTSQHIHSTRDPTPSKPKTIALDLLRENPNGFTLLQPSPQNKQNDSSLIVEVSHSTSSEDEPQTSDPPMDDSKFWMSPPRRRVPMDPEPTHDTGGESSILMGTAFADYDLMPRTGRPTPIRTSWATTFVLDDESQRSAHLNHVQSKEKLRFASDDKKDSQQNDPFYLNLPSTPAALDDTELNELSGRRPSTPQDAKEWLQTAHIALQDARAERDTARQWARDMKEAVQKWAEEQRKLIRCEASTRMDVLDERDQQVRLQTQALIKLESLIQQLHQDFQSTQSERQASETQIQKLILDQQERIRVLSQQLQSMEQAVSEGINSQANRQTPKSEISSHHAFPQFITRPAASSSQKSIRSNSSRVRKPLPGGTGHVILYSNGVEKEVHDDGTTVIRFTNGDVETTFAGGVTVAYFHAAEQVLQISNNQDGSILLEYPNGQIERHYANGVKAILFPDGTKAKISADGKVETYHRV